MELDTATAMVSRATAGIIESLSHEIPAGGAIYMASWCTKACSSKVFGLMSAVKSKPAEEFEEEDTEGMDLHKSSFSSTGGTLQLKCNRFYGLLGLNQCGKTTLIRAIVNEQLEGFPKSDELKSIFVEHEIEDEEVGVQDNDFPILSVDKPGWCWLMHTCNDIYKLETSVTEEQCKELMKSTGFRYPGGPDCAANLEMPVTNYSGRWKMQLCAALLMNCDVFMRDEPTRHLDVDHIRLLEDRKLKIFKDERQATMADFQTKLLIQPGVEKHLGDFGG